MHEARHPDDQQRAPGVGLSFGGGRDLGLLITLVIAVHNIPEGLAISLVLVPRGTRVWQAAAWSIFSSLPQPLLAAPAFLAVATFAPLLGGAGVRRWRDALDVLPRAPSRGARGRPAGSGSGRDGAWDRGDDPRAGATGGRLSLRLESEGAPPAGGAPSSNSNSRLNLNLRRGTRIAPPRTMLLRETDRGLFCEAGDFYIDPWLPVDRAVITHAHGDHARWGCRSYLGSREGERVLRTRLGEEARIRTVEFGEALEIRGVKVSLHPAGHILGSAQVRVEHRGEVWVVSGDYKSEPDPTCTPFEPVRCHTFVTESTFGLPIYRWAPQAEVFEEVQAWWAANREAGRASVLFGYALGKAQRLLAGVLGREEGPIYCHGAVERLNRDYRESGISLPETTYAGSAPKGTSFADALIVAPPSAAGSGWLRRFGPASTAFASGWMRIRGARRRRSLDRGFVLSDHVDWPGLLDAIAATGAERVWVTHGYRDPVVRYLREHGVEAEAIASRWEGDESLSVELELELEDGDATSDPAAAEAGESSSREPQSEEQPSQTPPPNSNSKRQRTEESR